MDKHKITLGTKVRLIGHAFDCIVIKTFHAVDVDCAVIQAVGAPKVTTARICDLVAA